MKRERGKETSVSLLRARPPMNDKDLQIKHHPQAAEQINRRAVVNESEKRIVLFLVYFFSIQFHDFRLVVCETGVFAVERDGNTERIV